ncbi:MAG: endolytic transglycosylase MltG [Patescibacteria group bacterium]|nr:endolytic transglycosylase MltG [Patescibacteria group bacterium]MCL5262117.1 endolytic transglycosylase MltG [Patescibacteria group bacterium]
MIAGLILLVVLPAIFYGKRYLFPKEWPKTTITIPEGYTVAQIDELLTEVGVLKGGKLANFKPADFDYPFLDGVSGDSLEGFLFPDTYEFFLNSPSRVVAAKFLDNFGRKASGFLEPEIAYKTLILASMIEKEVPDTNGDRELVAGILENRLEAGMFLNVDATVCYAESPLGCAGVEDIDFGVDSRYNTYHYRGLPPGPIANPGISAIKAAAHPRRSDYLYYLSRPDTQETIFSKTLDEHNKNIVKYLK